jgi:enoyl-CoA hydratase/carnithine racemase
MSSAIEVTPGEVAELRLMRPLDDAALAEIEASCRAIHDDADVRVVVLTAAPGALDGGSATPTLPFRTLELMAQPVIAVIEGDATGAGLELALACDIRVASDGAAFALPQVAAGGIPSLGGTARLPRIAGRATATAMLLLGARLSASEALACGLVNAIAPAADVRDRALAIARSIASRGPLAVRYAREALQRGLDLPLEAALRYETDLTVILQTTRDRDEGVRAFVERRPPRFTGH